MRSIGIEAPRPTEPRRGEGHPAPVTRNMAVCTQPVERPYFGKAFCVWGRVRPQDSVSRVQTPGRANHIWQQLMDSST